MSEKQKEILKNLADKLPTMTERERGYLEGTIATAAAMSKKGEKMQQMQQMQIQGTEIQIKEYQGKRVVTLKDIDAVHQRKSGTASRNFNQNRNRFIEDVDFSG